jgi:FkbM family methyltransferase
MDRISEGAGQQMDPYRRRINLDLVEFSLIAMLLVVSAGVLGNQLGLQSERKNAVQSARELEYFESTYGPDHYSEREEEWLIRDYFQDRRGGVFVDVGANHYKSASKTYYLESQLGWSGLAIEPQQQFAADYTAQRPRTKFLSFFVSDQSNELAKLYVTGRSSLVASSDKAFVEQFGAIAEVRDVPTITLTDLLDAEGITHIDFLSMDIELHEPKALEGFDIQRFRPSLVCIEGLLPVRQNILNYFARNGYVLVGKYMWADLENLYFVPVEDAKTQG